MKVKKLFEETKHAKFMNEHGIKTAGLGGVGFSEKEQKWYGWSHRAIHGFKIGDIVKEGDCCASSGWTDDYIKKHPEKDTSLSIGFIAKTLEDCKKMAMAFSDSVS